MDARYRFGIEEEYFLADASTRGTPDRTQPFHDAVRTRLPTVERELLAAQVEVATQPTDDTASARAQLLELRTGLTETAREHGLLVLASGTHPLARWELQQQTRKEHYDRLMQQMQMLGQRNVVCGMHVHVEVPRPAERVDLMNRMLPFTPLLLALSASSPFWQGRDTGLAAYRLSVWGEMPRTGLPDLFEDAADYDCYVAAMTRAGAITDASFLWWTLRPSIRYPTLELRVADSCTRLEDTLGIAALYRCLVRLLDRSPALNRGQTGAARAITAENLWRAQRDGSRAEFMDKMAARCRSPPGSTACCRRWRRMRRHWAARLMSSGFARWRRRARVPTGSLPHSRPRQAMRNRHSPPPSTGSQPRRLAPHRKVADAVPRQADRLGL